MFTLWAKFYTMTWFLKHHFIWRVQGIPLESITNTSYIIQGGRKGIKKFGHQPICKNSSSLSAWSEAVGSRVNISVGSVLLWCKAEAQLTWWDLLQVKSGQSPRRNASDSMLTVTRSVLRVLIPPHTRVSLLFWGVCFATVWSDRVLLVLSPFSF